MMIEHLLLQVMPVNLYITRSLGHLLYSSNEHQRFRPNRRRV